MTQRTLETRVIAFTALSGLLFLWSLDFYWRAPPRAISQGGDHL